jgi:predicted amidohydrolase
MSVESLNLASICMTSTDDRERNIEEALHWVAKAATRGADWVLLPEVFAYHGAYDKIHAMGEVEGGALSDRLAAAARLHKVCLFAGSYGEQAAPGEVSEADEKGRLGHRRVFNTSYVFDRQGQQVAKYRKTHLFNLLSPKGDALYCESDGFMAGDEPVSFDLDGFRVGLGICYDLRFPAYFERLAKDSPLDIIVLPSAFTLQTGMDHWELLLRARAVEQQAYMFAANQTGDHGRGRMSYGHSMIIDPWGYVLANTGGIPGVAVAEAQKSRIQAVRDRLPALRNRRPEIYE